MWRMRHQAAAAIEISVVNAPGIDPDRHRRTAEAWGGEPQAFDHLCESRSTSQCQLDPKRKGRY